SLNCTVPVGLLPVTVAVNVTLWPNVDGLSDEARAVVVGAAAPVAVTQAENSDVSPTAPKPSPTLAVEVMTRPPERAKVTLKLALPAPSVMTFEVPRNARPSPLPLASQAALEKNSR